MGLSPLKSCIKEIEQNAFLCSHFLEISLFQTKYLENILYSVSLLIYIWGLVEHGHMQKNDFQKNQLQFQQAAGRMWKRLWDELNVICKNKAPNIWRGKKECKYLHISKLIFTMKGAWGQNVIFRFFLELHKIWVHAKFQSGLTPCSGFLPIDIPFLANIYREYFSFNILTALYQSELELKALMLWIAT